MLVVCHARTDQEIFVQPPRRCAHMQRLDTQKLQGTELAGHVIIGRDLSAEKLRGDLNPCIYRTTEQDLTGEEHGGDFPIVRKKPRVGKCQSGGQQTTSCQVCKHHTMPESYERDVAT